jgi:hypothetical protein
MTAAGEGRKGPLELALILGGIRVPAVGNGFADGSDFLLGNQGPAMGIRIEIDLSPSAHAGGYAT